MPQVQIYALVKNTIGETESRKKASKDCTQQSCLLVDEELNSVTLASNELNTGRQSAHVRTFGPVKFTGVFNVLASQDNIFQNLMDSEIISVINTRSHHLVYVKIF